MKITISGQVGSGKSTVAKLLAKKKKYSYYSTGEFMRAIAKERKVTIMELSDKAESDPSIDKELDKKQIEIGKKEDNFVMDSRLGFYFIPDSFKILLTVDIKEAAKRIHKDKREGETFKDIDEAIDSLEKRMMSEKKRYKEYYNIEFPKINHFDLIIDTSDKKPEEIVEGILKT